MIFQSVYIVYNKKYGMFVMEITDYIIRLLNNHVERYNTRCSYWVGDERQTKWFDVDCGIPHEILV